MKKSKRALAALVLIGLLLSSITSCGKQTSSAFDKEKIEETTGLKITAEIPEKYAAELGSYRVEWSRLDHEKLLDAFIGKKPDQEMQTATGMYYMADEKKFLTVEDKEGRDNTSFFYNSYESSDPDQITKENEKRDLKLKLTPSLGGRNQSVRPGNEKLLQYNENMELSFSGKKDVVQNIETILHEIGLSEVQLKTIYVRDKDTLNKNLEIINQAESEFYENGMETDTTVFTEKDEDYFLRYRQSILMQGCF